MEDKFRFKKKYGQNFLKNKALISRIASVIDITKDDLVVEVGPGFGILTVKLAERAKNVLTYEIDEEVLETLKNNLASYDNVQIIVGDFLKQKIENDISSYHFSHLYFVGNIPYYITTPILFKLASSTIPFDEIVVMVQKEVGDRICAKPQNKIYGSLSVLLQYQFDVKKEFIVSKKEFHPEPKVDSIIISLKKKKIKESIINEQYFYKLVQDSFQYKRKTIRNNLRGYDLSIIEKILKEHGYDLTVRAEALSYQIFIDIANALCS